jgi:hypothetical protein
MSSSETVQQNEAVNERAEKALSLLISFRVFRYQPFFSVVEASALASCAASLVTEAELTNDKEINFPTGTHEQEDVFNSLTTLTTFNVSSGDTSADNAARALICDALGELANSRAASKLLSPRQRARLQGLSAEFRARERAASLALEKAKAEAEAHAAARLEAASLHITMPPAIERLVSDWVLQTHSMRLAKPIDIVNRNEALTEMHFVLSRILRCPISGPGALLLQPFGSTRSGFDSGGMSDVDCILLVDGTRHTNDTAWKFISRSWMFSPPRGWTNIEVISFARVPILRAIHERSLVQLDVCVGHEMGLLNTELLHAYTLTGQNCQLAAVGVSIKAWAKERGCANASKGTLSSYGWICLLIFFAQRCGLVPVLTSDENIAAFIAAGSPGSGGHENERIISGWKHRFVDNGEWAARFAARLTPAADVTIALDTLKALPSSPGALLLSFFRFASLIFAGVVSNDNESSSKGGCLSIRTGKYLPKRSCETALPLVDEHGKVLGTVGARSKKLRPSRPKPTPQWRLISIEDPFELHHDLARSISVEGQRHIQQELSAAVAALEGASSIGTSHDNEESFSSLSRRISAITGTTKPSSPAFITFTAKKAEEESSHTSGKPKLRSSEDAEKELKAEEESSHTYGKPKLRSSDDAAKELAEKLGRSLSISGGAAAASPVDDKKATSAEPPSEPSLRKSTIKETVFSSLRQRFDKRLLSLSLSQLKLMKDEAEFRALVF